jgi:Predicted membrane protein
MISDFIYKYYIDPIRYEQPYNIVETLTYALILVAAVFLIYRWFKKSDIAIDGPFVLATIPYVIFGGVLRVIQDTHMIQSDIQFLIVTPFIYFIIFFYTISILIISRYLTKQGMWGNYLTLYAGAGIFSVFCVSLVLVGWGMTHAHLDLFVLAVIPLMAVTATILVWSFMRYVLNWKYVTDPLYLTLLFGQLLDASATSYGIDLHPSIHYIEQHVVGSSLIEMTHTAFVMFPLKLVVLFPAIYIMEQYRKEANPAFWHLVLLAMIVVGFAPGIRDMTRMVLYV